MREEQKKLLGELEEYRWHLMRLLADEAEENGQEEESLGWRYMADKRRYPVNDLNSYGWTFAWTHIPDDLVRSLTWRHFLPKKCQPFFPNRIRERREAQLHEQNHLLMSARAIGKWLRHTRK